MRLILCLAAAAIISIDAFESPAPRHTAPRRTSLFRPFKLSTSEDTTIAPTTTSTPTPENKKTLALLTFDLDDTLYPIGPVVAAANAGFARAMEGFGYKGVEPMQIIDTAVQIRDEMAETDPQAAAALSHTEIRKLAIRRVMESITFERKIESVAEDWATPVTALAPVIVQNAKKWAQIEVTSSVVQAVYNVWEMERHHSAERNIYPELIDVFKEIKQKYPNVLVGAVTDGKANPMFMTFTLAPYFDFCMSWEDDQAGRTQFFKELGSVSGDAEVKWIYEATKDKYKELSEAAEALKKPEEETAKSQTIIGEDAIWIHVGDDLAYDVGGSATCGAKTIYVELAEKYGQTARHRFSNEKTEQPDWSTTTMVELQKRKRMNEAAEGNVDKRISFMSRLPEAVFDIMKEAENE